MRAPHIYGRWAVFVRSGSIIPMLDTVMNTEDYNGKEYKLHLYPAESESEFVLYFDDGVHLSFDTLSDCMDISSIAFEIFVHKGGEVTHCGTVEYKKDMLDLVL